MLVLIAVCFALVVSLALRVFGDSYQHTYGNGWPIIQFAVLLLAHGLAGLSSWTADARGWGDRLLWLAAIHLHGATYALNWPVYAGFARGATGLTAELLPTLAALLLIIAPSILMYGGPVAALVNPPARRPTKDLP